VLNGRPPALPTRKEPTVTDAASGPIRPYFFGETPSLFFSNDRSAWAINNLLVTHGPIPGSILKSPVLRFPLRKAQRPTPTTFCLGLPCGRPFGVKSPPAELRHLERILFKRVGKAKPTAVQTIKPAPPLVSELASPVNGNETPV